MTNYHTHNSAVRNIYLSIYLSITWCSFSVRVLFLVTEFVFAGAMEVKKISIQVM